MNTFELIHEVAYLHDMMLLQVINVGGRKKTKTNVQLPVVSTAFNEMALSL